MGTLEVRDEFVEQVYPKLDAWVDGGPFLQWARVFSLLAHQTEDLDVIELFLWSAADGERLSPGDGSTGRR